LDTPVHSLFFQEEPNAKSAGGTMHKSDDLMGAITQLIMAGLAFTSERQRDGKTIYMVDSVGLTEDELVLLHHKRALTPDGIRRYLVGRDLVPRAA
jgi:hypothetical protein